MGRVIGRERLRGPSRLALRRPGRKLHAFLPAENGAGMDSYILVVDDDADLRELLAEALTSLGYAVEQAENGRVALNTLEEHLPALVLLDLKMPIMSGWAVLEALKNMPHAAGIPVLVISAYGFEWEAELIGAAGYIGKPVDIDALRAKVHSLVGLPRPALLH